MKGLFGRLSLLGMLILLAACSGGSIISVVDAWARPAEAGQNSAAYFQMHNSGNAPEALLSASANISRAVEIHESMAVDMSSDAMDMESESDAGALPQEAMQMVPQERVDIPMGETLVFQPGGLHVMLIDLNAPLSVGEHFFLTLNFESGLSIELDVEVKAP